MERYKGLFFIALICVSFETACDLLCPTFMARIINEGIEKGSLTSVYRWGARMLSVTALGALFAVARNILASRVSQRFGADLRYDLFDKILHFSEQSADNISSGSLIMRMTNDVTQETQFVNGLMRIFLKAPLTCAGGIVLASLLNQRLSLIVYAVVALVALLLYIGMKISYPRFGKLQQAMDKLNTGVEEYLIGVRLVKAFGTGAEETRKLDADNRDLMEKSVWAMLLITCVSPFLTLIVGFGSAAIIYAGSLLFTQGLTQPGDISAFIVYMAQILSSLLMITNLFNIFARTKASSQRIREVLESGDDFPRSFSPERLPGTVEFEDVTFSYPGGSGIPALRNLSFRVGEGESLAVIGPTGAGKSTIAWLLLRLYDTDSGTIRLGGRDIRTLGSDVIRENVAVVPQRAMLFSGTVRENLAWGSRDASDGEILSAARRASADFLESMPDGLLSRLGSGGVNLSGGQKQRLSIARGLVKNAPVLVLDDATSALDAVTEAKVRESLLSGSGTTILVTQRCSTAMFADRILVLEDGECKGFGTHGELMESCGVYRDIFDSQLGGVKEAE